MGDRGGSSSGAWAPASYTRSFSLRAATWNKAAQTLRAPAERRVVAEHPGDTPVLLTCPLAKLPRWLLTSAWSCWQTVAYWLM